MNDTKDMGEEGGGGIPVGTGIHMADDAGGLYERHSDL